MSAYLVSREHIDLLTDVIMRGPRDVAFNPTHAWSLPLYLDDDLRTADQIGRELWTENLKSINARYPDTIDHPESMPGPAGITLEEISGYTFTRQPYRLTIPEAMKAAHCYRYQSCEHPEWESSRAYGILCDLLDTMTHILPGYREAPWEWDADAIASAMAAAR